MLKKVTVAVLTWNGLQHLEICLEALRRQKDPGIPWEILVLDNGSSDGTAEWVEGWIGRSGCEARLLTSPVNLGFCGGCNRLVHEARGEGVAFVNNDTRPREDWLASLVDAMQAAPEDVAAVSGTILDWSGERLDFGRGILTFDGHAFQLGYHQPLESVDLPASGSELLFPCGGNMLVRRRSFLEAGGFDPTYFAYLEDVDLGWRLWSGGERVTFVSEAVAHHRSMATSALLGQFNRGLLFERNALLTAYKNYESGIWERMMPAILLTFLSRTQTMLVENNPGGSLLALDPYGGMIANTADDGDGGPRAADRWHGKGLAGLWRRARARLGRLLIAGPGGSRLPVLSDERTIAQLRATDFVLQHLDASATARAAVQARRRRPDSEIFERFPLYLVPTYPGDEELFASPGFESWLPEEPVLVRRTLDQIMSLD